MASKITDEFKAALDAATIAPGLTGLALASGSAPALRRPSTAFGSAFAHLLATPGARSDDPIFSQPPLPKEAVMAPTIPNEPSPDAADPAAQATIDLADDLAAYFAANELTCSLHGPQSLTTYKQGKGFSKTSHIGGEDFKPLNAYVGKKGKILIRFEPKEPVAYSHMEMPADEAVMKMSAFAEMAGQCDYMARLAAIRQKIFAARDAEVAAVKVQEYADYGSW